MTSPLRTRALVAAAASCVVLAASCTDRAASDKPQPESSAATGIRYYLSPAGSDTADGRSPESAWQTLARVNAQRLAPGDEVLLQGGAHFDGPLILEPEDRGSIAAPIVVTSGPGGPAVIDSTGTAGIYIHSTSGIAVSGIDIAGGAGVVADGIAAFNESSARLVDGVSISDVDVSGFINGISVGGTTTGFGAVTVRDSQIHDNARDGLTFYGPRIDAAAPVYANADVLVDGVASFANTGQPDDLTSNSGSGIIIGSTERATVTRSVAHSNGALCNAPLGPSGIWSYDSTKVLFESNVSYSNHTGTGTADGNGFDFDVNTSDSVMQYNLSYGNDGAGFFVFTFEPNSLQQGNTVRYNVSSNDVRRREFYAGLMIATGAPATAPKGTGIARTQLYNNTIVMSANAEGRPAAFRMYGDLSDVVIANNVFVTSGGSPLAVADGQSPEQTRMAGNLYFSADGAPIFQWDSTRYGTFEDWSASTDQERTAGASTGTYADPQLPSAFAAVPVTDAAQLRSATNLRTPVASPAALGGIDLQALGIDRGRATYFSDSHPCPGPGVGAAC